MILLGSGLGSGLGIRLDIQLGIQLDIKLGIQLDIKLGASALDDSLLPLLPPEPAVVPLVILYLASRMVFLL